MEQALQENEQHLRVALQDANIAGLKKSGFWRFLTMNHTILRGGGLGRGQAPSRHPPLVMNVGLRVGFSFFPHS